jgi:hypothetical protein
MKTYDGSKLIQQRLDQVYSKFPEGSLSPRELFHEVSLAKIRSKKELDDLAFAINSKITHAIYMYADEFMKSQEKFSPSEMKDKLSNTVLKFVK